MSQQATSDYDLHPEESGALVLVAAQWDQVLSVPTAMSHQPDLSDALEGLRARGLVEKIPYLWGGGGIRYHMTDAGWRAWKLLTGMDVPVSG